MVWYAQISTFLKYHCRRPTLSKDTFYRHGLSAIWNLCCHGDMGWGVWHTALINTHAACQLQLIQNIWLSGCHRVVKLGLHSANRKEFCIFCWWSVVICEPRDGILGHQFNKRLESLAPYYYQSLLLAGVRKCPYAETQFWALKRSYSWKQAQNACFHSNPCSETKVSASFGRDKIRG